MRAPRSSDTARAVVALILPDELADGAASGRPDAAYLMPGREDPAAGIPFGYGYQWWIPGKPQGDFAAIGIYGQFIYVNPARKVVIAKTSAYADYNNSGGAMEYETIDAFQAIANAL